ncbi:MAG: rfaE bifunctional protein kinase chain/domain [Sphingobacteriales bacterium]|jgi:rfaE bifunctional protein kinase chain/domain
MKFNLDSFIGTKVLIIGDAMIDSYYRGKVDRISPEAPVPIVSVMGNESRLGGAANVALNIQSLGGIPILCAMCGLDDQGKKLRSLLLEANMAGKGILSMDHRPTTVKTRIIAGNQQLLRVDQEDSSDLDKKSVDYVIKHTLALLIEEEPDVVIFEDYDKGFISKRLIQKVVSACNERNIPTVVDPKKRNFMAYKGVTLFKPNLKELVEGLKVEVDRFDLPRLNSACDVLRDSLGASKILLTLSENGVLLSSEKEKRHILAHVRNIADVSGAGDTVISIAALALANKFTDLQIANLANLGGGLVCEKVGVVPIDLESLKLEAEKH